MLGIGEEGFGSALLEDDAFVHEDDTAADVPGEGHLVRDDEHGHALVGKTLHDGEDLADHLGVERARRFVEQEDLRVHGQRAGDGHALLLAAGELAGLGVDIGGHADLFKIAHGLLVRLVFAAAENLHLADHAVFEDGHVVEEIEGLEDHADVGAVFGGVDALAGDVFAVVEDLAARRGLEQVDAAQERRFAGAGGADDGDDVALADGKVDIAQDLVRAEGLAQVPDLKNVVCHLSGPPFPRRIPCCARHSCCRAWGANRSRRSW